MKVDSCSIRGFVANYTDVCSSDINLDSLVVEYRQNPNSSCYATIYNKILGTVLNFGRKFDNSLGITPEDIYSYGMTALYKALDEQKGWKADSGVKFLTYFYRIVHNEFVTLGQTKYHRNYQKHTVSLDELLDEENDEFSEKLVLEEGKSELSNQCKFYQPRAKDCARSLDGELEENKYRLCLSLGLSMEKVELAILAGKVKFKLASTEEIEHFKKNKKEFKEVKKYLKQFV